jgi:riboflavin kinase / FMN adenylyltransferase
VSYPASSYILAGLEKDGFEVKFSVESKVQSFIRGAHNLRSWHQGCVATLGSFDGVHLGHQAILRQLVRLAKETQLPSLVIIFEPQPQEFFLGDKAPARLMRLREKIHALLSVGVDRVLCLSFNEYLRGLSANDFIEQVLIRGVDVKHLVIGDDFRFGCDRRGDFALLKQVGNQKGFSVTDTVTLEMQGERVSSTRVRQCLEEGNFAAAEILLGKPYSISGRIVYGQQLGRQLGVPTANVHLRRYKSPLQGVFAVTAKVEGKSIQGVANIGVRPTVNGDKKLLLEVHLFDFSQKIYGKMIEVVFHKKLRSEKKFASLDELQTQLKKDIDEAKEFFNLYPSP